MIVENVEPGFRFELVFAGSGGSHGERSAKLYISVKKEVTFVGVLLVVYNDVNGLFSCGVTVAGHLVGVLVVVRCAAVLTCVGDGHLRDLVAVGATVFGLCP